jgi:hypothetical protein
VRARRSWLNALILGALLGTIVLGLGGRLAMRIFALLEGLTPGSSLGGSLTVLFLGACWGLGGGFLQHALGAARCNATLLIIAAFPFD